MKIRLCMLFAIGCFMLAVCCDINPGRQEPSPAPVTGAENSAQYRYMDWIYSAASGQSLNSTYLSGPIYSLYPDKVQDVVNRLLRFPMQTEADGITVTGPWWDSVPGDIKQYMVDNNYAALSDGLLSMAGSEIGEQIILALLDETRNQLEDVIHTDIPAV